MGDQDSQTAQGESLGSLEGVQYEQELREPHPEDLLALEQMLSQQQWVNAEISAQMMVNDYPGSATAQA